MSGFSKLLEAAAKRSNFEPDLRFFQSVWEDIIPAPFCHRSRPCGWSNGVLHVEVGSKWMEEFTYQQNRLVHRLNDALPWKVTRLEIREGQFEPAPQKAVSSPPDDEPLDDLELPDLGDERLNELALAISRHVSRAQSNE